MRRKRANLRVAHQSTSLRYPQATTASKSDAYTTSKLLKERAMKHLLRCTQKGWQRIIFCVLAVGYYFAYMCCVGIGLAFTGR
jgi:hypothetical protein